MYPETDHVLAKFHLLKKLSLLSPELFQKQF